MEPSIVSSRIVLIVEDDDELRALFAMALRRAGYLAFDARDGWEAIEYVRFLQARQNHLLRPDLILLDFRMPGPSGLDVLREIRRYDLAMPVILVTAFGDRETHAAAKRLGAALSFDKPVDVAELVAAVRTLAPCGGAPAAR